MTKGFQKISKVKHKLLAKQPAKQPSKQPSKQPAKMMTRSKTSAVTSVTSVSAATVHVASSNVPAFPENAIVYPTMFNRWAEPL